MPRGGKRPGSRRKKGVPNKVTADVREAILKAFDLAGGVEYLCAVAREDPAPSWASSSPSRSAATRTIRRCSG